MKISYKNSVAKLSLYNKIHSYMYVNGVDPKQSAVYKGTALKLETNLFADARALDHPIWGPKIGPIPNAKKCFFYPISDKKFSI